jgi:FlaA1/EpsC-like NDP-sugar epimerase
VSNGVVQETQYSLPTIVERVTRRIFDRAVFKRVALFGIDIVVSGLGFSVAVVLSQPSELSYARLGDQIEPILLFMGICAAIFPGVGMYNRNWRYASVMDLVVVVLAALLSCITFTVVAFGMSFHKPALLSTIGTALFVLPCLLASVRLSFRAREAIRRGHRRIQSEQDQLIPILLVGKGNAADHYLRALERDPNCTYRPIGILDSDPSSRGLLHRGVPVLGTFADFELVFAALNARGQRPRHLVFMDSLARNGDGASALLDRAERLGIACSRLRAPTEFKNPRHEAEYELRPVELTDLLERSQLASDRAAVQRLISGRRVLVTGAGGSIGKELALQVAALEPADLVLLDSCEYNLYSIELELKERFASLQRHCYLCNVREIVRVDEIFDRHQPEIVFHAAALKHVPLVELNPCEGALTNVLGTMHVAAAAKRTGVLAMVQVSTDKVVNPASVMGATKRLAELYCQALDLENKGELKASRFMTVRFGNVLGSSGSLIPLFQRQLARGGPLTVTDAEMKRFFMTIREAVELTLQASAYGLEQCLGQGEIFVLDMGEPIRIIDIARRMIRLAGFTPDKDIKIEIIGPRPGEKLCEELFDPSEALVESRVPGVFGAVPHPVELSVLSAGLLKLKARAEAADVNGVIGTLCELLPEYKRTREDKNPTSEQVSVSDLSRLVAA